MHYLIALSLILISFANMKTSLSAGNYKLIKRGHQCTSRNIKLGIFRSNPVQKCADLCQGQNGCKYFIIKNNGATKNCKWEKTTDFWCPEGWVSDTYDFYGLTGKSYHIHILARETI